MKEHPVFVPYRSEHLAAVITLPDEAARGLVTLSTGLGATRSHRFGMWTRTARRLAEGHAVASVRWEYPGVGDSTGDIWTWGLNHLPLDATEVATRFAMDALGVERVAAAGNCLGSWASLTLASRMPECIGACLIRMPVLEAGGAGRLKRASKRSKLLRAARRSRPIRVIAKPLSGARRGPVLPLVRDAFPGALAHGRLMFLYGEDDFTFNPSVRRALERMAAEAPQAYRERQEIRALAGQRLQGFETVEVQQTVIDAVVDWLGGLFATADGGRVAEPSA